MRKIAIVVTIAGAGFGLAACQSSDGGQPAPLPSVAPQYGSTADIADFQGARAGQAEGGLNARGYEYVRSQGLTSFYWNAQTQTCARIVTSNGRFSEVTTAARSDCNQSSGSGNSTNVSSAASQYGSTADIADFQGARAGQAEGGLNARGYEYVRSQGLTSYYWNAQTQTCARIVTSNGRFSEVAATSRSDCNR